MLRFLRNFEPFSFWLGFLVASLFWWMMRRFAPVFREFRKNIAEQASSARESAKAGVEFHYRNDLIHITQTMHLAAPLFSLNEILIPPRLMATPPLPPTDSETDAQGKLFADITMQAIPYLPDWPELSAAFNAPTYSLSEAAAKGTNLILIGHAGSGKTVALAHLAGQMARNDLALGEELSTRLPVLVHFGDLPTAELEADQPVNAIHTALNPKMSSRTNAKLTNLLENSFTQGRVLLMVDGMDELEQDEFLRAARFVEMVLNLFPGTQVIATASPFYYDGLAQLGLIPVALAAWNNQQRSDFVKLWGERWSQHILPTVWKVSANGKEDTPPLEIEAAILNNWIMVENLAGSPLEMTLKVWAAYAGDARGPANVNAFEAYFRRMTVNIRDAGTALERVALQMSLKTIPFPTQRSAIRWSRGITLEDVEDITIPTSETEEEIIEDSDIKSDSVSRQAIPNLINSGILVNRADTRVGFVHPSIGGYFAGRALAAAGGSSWVQNQPHWIGKQQALKYLAHFGTPLGSTSSFANLEEDVIRQQLLFAARWLPESLSHPKATWRIGLMRELFNLIGGRFISVGLRARALTALLLSNDPGIPQMCKRLLQHEDPDVRQIATIGLGYLKDSKSVNELGELLYEPDRDVQRAASLALVAIGTQPTLEAVATALLHGDENLQRAASEALANHPEEGHPVLKEASTFDDLLARRAAVYGLARVQESWARDIIEGMRTQDKEWIVRNAAEEVAIQLDKGKSYIPNPMPPLHENTWLLLFAAKSGEGVSPGQGAEEMLLNALMRGDESERLVAMYQLRFASRDAGESAISTLYGVYLQEHDELQEAAYLALWHLVASGHELPSPIKFGIGTQNW